MTIEIGGRAIGPGCPAYVIAEACDNHLGDLGVAMEMARQAKLAGADAVKYQHHLPDEEMLPDVPMSDNFGEPLYEFLKRHALKLGNHVALMKYCEEIGIQYLCTPFSFAAARDLMEIGVHAFKIGSGEMTDIPSLRRIAGFGLPMIVSTGMSTFDELDLTYNALRGRVPLALTHCVSEYPPLYEDMNLRVITELQQRYPEAVIGHSDHTPDLFTCFAAVTLGACIIEKHIILDKRQPGPDQSVSIDPRDLHELVTGIRKIESALGSTKAVHAREAQIREWAFRSIVTLRPIASGEPIAADAVWTKRPGTGIPSRHLPEVIGRTAARDLPANALLAWTDLV